MNQDRTDERSPVKLGVMISGRGTNLQAIIDSIERGELKAEIRIVISNRAAAYGLERAKGHGIETEVLDHRRFKSREEFDAAAVARLRGREVELVVCAGFMRLFSSVMVRAFPNRIMNIHPALLPTFPGLHVQQAAIDYGVKFSGCTVFFVDEGTDAGPIIVQAVVPVLQNDDEATLSARILAQEHRIYPYAIGLYQQRRLEISGRRVLVKDEARCEGAMVNPQLR
ncbi:MAG TPA: phosphoribosylglycinamide formyltransferase [Candidatus Binataceae bacterium]